MNPVWQFLERKPIRWTLAPGWSLLLTLFLLQPEADPIIDLGLPKGDSTLWRELFFSGLHMLAFALTCALWFWRLRSYRDPSQGLLAAVIIAIGLGVATEAMQTMTLDRHASLIDLLANIGGALIAARLIWRRRLWLLPA